MAARTVTVTTTPTRLCVAKTSSQRAWITLDMDPAETQTVYIGIDDATVTAATGKPLDPGGSGYLENTAHAKPASKEIWGRTASGTAVVRVQEGT